MAKAEVAMDDRKRVTIRGHAFVGGDLAVAIVSLKDIVISPVGLQGHLPLCGIACVIMDATT